MSYAFALLASMVVAWTVTPVLCSLLLAKGSAGNEPSPFVAALERAHASMLSKLVPSAGLAFIVTAVLAVAAVGLLPMLRATVLPRFQERNLVVRLRAMPGTSQPEMSRLTGRARAELLAIKGVHDVSAHIGRAILGDQAVDVHSGELWVTIDPSADYAKTTGAIQKVIDGYPGVSHRVETYLGQVSEDVVASPEDKLVTRVYGETEAGLRERAEQVRAAISGVAGLKNARIRRPIQEAAIETNVDVTAAQRYGLKPGDVRRAAATLMSGIVVGNLYEEQKIFEVVVWSTPETRQSISSVRDLLIDTPGGGHVRLGDVAKVRIVPASSSIKHDAVKRYIDVTADVEGRELAAVAADISKQIGQLQFPLEYHAEVQGGFALANIARERFITFAIAAAIGIFFLLQAAFASWRLAGLAFWTLPASVAGGVLAIFLTGGTLSMSALAGLLAVFAIAIYHRLVLIHRFQQIERSEGQKLGRDLVLQGARECLPSMALATLASAAAMLPVLFLGQGAGLEMVRPMAIVVLGGLASSTVLDLLFLPTMFLALGVSSAREPDPFHETLTHGYPIAAEPSGAAGH
jgi:Cu/Ag efflux pump CusA